MLIISLYLSLTTAADIPAEFAISIWVLSSSSIVVHTAYIVEAAIDKGFLWTGIYSFISSFIIFIALCLIFSCNLRLFAIFTIHFIGSIMGIGFKLSSKIRSLEYFEILLTFALVISDISFNVLGVSNSLHAK